MKVKKLLAGLVLSGSCFLTSMSFADSVTIKMHLTTPQGPGHFIGEVQAVDTPYGLLIKPHLYQLPPGLHGFHVHVNASCEDKGMAAGGHLDPQHTGRHLGPYDALGHLGDLPALYVSPKEVASLPILAPRLKVEDLRGHTLIIHAGGDNYSDSPTKLGGGGERLACGVVP